MEKTENQKQVWNRIASDWYLFRKKPSERITEFLEQQGKILDLGSGSGRHLVDIKNGKMYLVDFSEKMIELAKQKAKKENIKAEFFVSDMTQLPFKNNFFDAAICIASLHCIQGKENRKKAVKEIYRVLKPKAEVKVVVWNKDSKRFKNSTKEKYVGWLNKAKRYYYLYDEKEIHDLFKDEGFKIKKRWEPARQIAFVAEKA